MTVPNNYVPPSLGGPSDVIIHMKGFTRSRSCPTSTTLAEMFLVERPELADLATCHRFEDTLVIWRVLHQLIELWHRALAIPLAQPVQKVGRDVIARVPPITAFALPVWGFEAGTKANPICACGGVFVGYRNESRKVVDMRTCDAFDETAGAGAVEVVLVTMDDLVDQYAADLVGATVFRVYDVLARKVDLLGRFRARGISHAVHGSKDEEDGLHTAKSAALAKRFKTRYPCDASQPTILRTSLGPCPWSCITTGGLRRSRDA